MCTALLLRLLLLLWICYCGSRRNIRCCICSYCRGLVLSLQMLLILVIMLFSFSFVIIWLFIAVWNIQWVICIQSTSNVSFRWFWRGYIRHCHFMTIIYSKKRKLVMKNVRIIVFIKFNKNIRFKHLLLVKHHIHIHIEQGHWGHKRNLIW